MPAYVIGAVESINDPAGFAEYGQLVRATFAKYGGKLIAGGSDIEVGDGSWSPIRVAVIEFESMDRLKEWYNSPEYSPVKLRRLQTATSGVIFLNAG